MHIFPYLAGGMAAVLAMEYGPPATRHLGTLPALTAEAPAASAVQRARKGDQLASRRAQPGAMEISVVEVVGLHNAAVIYRDRDGRELFRTDPISNVTVVTKGLSLPEVTIRQGAGVAVQPMRPVVREVPTETPASRNQPKPQRTKVPLGCEPSFSPVAQPAMAHHTGRCMAALTAPVQVAELSR